MTKMDAETQKHDMLEILLTSMGISSRRTTTYGPEGSIPFFEFCREMQHGVYGVGLIGFAGSTLYMGYTNDNILEDLLLNKIYHFSGTDRDKKSLEIRNPYLGCRSLEEALIKKDLLN